MFVLFYSKLFMFVNSRIVLLSFKYRTVKLLVYKTKVLYSKLSFIKLWMSGK